MESKIIIGVKSKLEKIIKRKNQMITDVRKSEKSFTTPKFSTDIRLPSISPTRSFKVLPKPYPITKVNITPTLTESNSAIFSKKASPLQQHKNKKNIKKYQISSIKQEFHLSNDKSNRFQVSELKNKSQFLELAKNPATFELNINMFQGILFQFL